MANRPPAGGARGAGRPLAGLSLGAAPRWERVSRGRSYEWHDHRIHWMSTIDPPAIREAPDQVHHVFDWMVHGRVGDRPLAIRGSLDYEPPLAPVVRAI